MKRALPWVLEWLPWTSLLAKETAKQESSVFSTIPDYHVGEKGSIGSFFVRIGRKLKKRCMVSRYSSTKDSDPKCRRMGSKCSQLPACGEGLPAPSPDLPAQSLPASWSLPCSMSRLVGIYCLYYLACVAWSATVNKGVTAPWVRRPSLSSWWYHRPDRLYSKCSESTYSDITAYHPKLCPFSTQPMCRSYPLGGKHHEDLRGCFIQHHTLTAQNNV